MTKDEVREVAGEPGSMADLQTMMLEQTRKAMGKPDGDESDLESMVREAAEAEGIEISEDDSPPEFPAGVDMWTYFDLPEPGNLTSVSFKNGRVFMVSYGPNDD